MLNHGGNLQRAQVLYPTATQPWLDLSTGISPWVWPVPEIPESVWQRLPEGTAALCHAAAEFYRCDEETIVPVTGSQAAIELIPNVLPLGRVALPEWGYGEHRKSWQQSQHDCCYYQNQQQLHQWIVNDEIDYVVVINPNNPTAETFDLDRILQWQQQLQLRGGYLLVDEAFAQQISCANYVPQGGLIVLKSLGKFFGLAGVRLGFALLPPELNVSLREKMLHWGVSNPAIWIAERALSDVLWQQQQRNRIAIVSNEFQEIIAPLFPSEKISSAGLFVSVFGTPARLGTVFIAFAQRGIWLRIFQPIEQQTYLRFGLPHDSQWPRIKTAVNEIIIDLAT